MTTLLGALLLAGCGDDAGPQPQPDFAVVPFDLAVALDMARLPDLACAPQTFNGFVGGSDTPRTLDCTCGCILDSFDGNFVSSFWGNPRSGAATFQAQSGGLALTLAHAPGSGVESGTLNSYNPVSPFYIAGDFDLTVDYRLPAPLPPDTHLILGTQPQLGAFTVERGRALDGTDDAVSGLGGSPVVQADDALSGSLELRRAGATVTALVDGDTLAQAMGAPTGPVGLTLVGALASCFVDGGGDCSASVVWHNLRLKGGALVDRR